MQFSRQCILVIDFGSQYTQILLRKIRELGVYSELCNWEISKSQLLKLNPNGIIFSGGPYSVINKYAPFIPNFIFELGIPILGICYGMQIMVAQLGGRVQSISDHREFGNTQVKILSQSVLIDSIYDDINNQGHAILDVWMSHKDTIVTLPNNFIAIAVTRKNNAIAIIENKQNHWFGVQFHPEVTYTKQGKNILKRFIINICGCQFNWKPMNIIKTIITDIQEKVRNDKVILAFSGGIDSFVTALLLKYAINGQFICIFIDNGLLCYNEIARINNFLKENYGLNIIILSEKAKFLNALSGITDPEEKRKIIGKVFLDIFEIQIRKFQDCKWLVQGTIYSDVIESGISTVHTTNVIKSHHNVGGLPSSIAIPLLEPIKNLFKDEVREIGLCLGLSHNVVYRYPFPGPGIAIRILGEVKEKYCHILRKADRIFIEELKSENLYIKVSQAFAVFLPLYSVGVQGDNRHYKWVIALRAIETIDFMTARWARLPYDFLDKVSNRIVNEIKDVSRVVYDISSKPPATIEWE